MSEHTLKVVLRHAYFHGHTCNQWAGPTLECIQRANEDLETTLCDLLIDLLFTLDRTTDPLLESYIIYATTSTSTNDAAPSSKTQTASTLVSPDTMLQRLVNCEESTFSRNAYQWSFFLKLIPLLLDAIHINPASPDGTAAELMKKVIIVLAHFIAIGLYPEHYANARRSKKAAPELVSALSFQHGGTQYLDSQRSMHTFGDMGSPTFDMEATLEMDIFPEPSTLESDKKDEKPEDDQSEKIEIANAIAAAQYLIHLIENKSAQAIFDAYHTSKQMKECQEPWITCQTLLTPPKNGTVSEATLNSTIQKVYSIIPRLTDRDLERRLAVHVKYRELEDEGTARAMPSAGLLGLLYHIVQIRPSLSDEDIVDRLVKLRSIKGSMDESFYLEMWLAALTGLREASLRTSCVPDLQGANDSTASKSVNSSVTTNRLLWRNMVLSKIPHLILKLEERKRKRGSNETSNVMANSDTEPELNTLESVLVQLKAFSGLLNCCSYPVCSIEYRVYPTKVSFSLDKPNLSMEDDDDDDIMKMINDMSDTVDLATPAFTKAITIMSSQDIFSAIVQSCEFLGLIHQSFALNHVKNGEESSEKKNEYKDEFAGLLNTSMIDDNTGWNPSVEGTPADKQRPTNAIDENLDQRMQGIRSSSTLVGVLELIYIGYVSPIHLPTIVDFILELVQEKVSLRDIYSLSYICDAIGQNPAFLELMMKYCRPQSLLRHLETFCNEWKAEYNDADIDTNMGGDEEDEDIDGVQLLYNKFGKIWTLVVLVMNRFNLSRDVGCVLSRVDDFCYQFFSRGCTIYGLDETDYAVEELITQWMTALGGNYGISDDLLRSTSPQLLLRSIPTLIDRLLLIYKQGQVEESTMVDMISYFQKKVLNFTLYPGVIMTLCDEMLYRNADTGRMLLSQLLLNDIVPPTIISLCSRNVIGSLETLAEKKKQQVAAGENRDAIELQPQQLWDHLLTKLDLKEDPGAVRLGKTITTGVSPDTLLEKTTTMFRFIVKSGRSKYMSDVDADTSSILNAKKPPKEQVSGCLDMVMFATALEMGGMHWFIGMIVDEVLEAGKSGGAVRAAELGSFLLATPLTTSPSSHLCGVHFLRYILQDIVPTALRQCRTKSMSYFQGQTLGAFVGSCLVLMHHGNEDKHDQVYDIGERFFSSLSHNGEPLIQRPDRPNTRAPGRLFVSWSHDVLQSAVWRGFLKGLMSNPLVNDIWPNTFSHPINAQ